jgi:hypothetical protein
MFTSGLENSPNPLLPWIHNSVWDCVRVKAWLWVVKLRVWKFCKRSTGCVETFA